MATASRKSLQADILGFIQLNSKNIACLLFFYEIDLNLKGELLVKSEVNVLCEVCLY